MPPLVISIAGRKGGVGKTTITVALASLYAAAGRSTVVVDLDPQSNVAFSLGTDPHLAGAADLITGARPEPQRAAPCLRVLAGGPELTEAAVISAHPDDLADALADIEADVVLIDCPPGNDALDRMAMAAANVALLVSDAHPFAAVGARRVLDEIQAAQDRGRRAPSRCAVVLSRIDERRKMDRDLADGAANIWGDSIDFLKVRQDVALHGATANQELVADACAGKRGLEDLIKVKEWCDGN